MTNQSNSYLRLHDIYSFWTCSCLIIFCVLLLQGPINVSAQVNQVRFYLEVFFSYERVMLMHWHDIRI